MSQRANSELKSNNKHKLISQRKPQIQIDQDNKASECTISPSKTSGNQLCLVKSFAQNIEEKKELPHIDHVSKEQ